MVCLCIDNENYVMMVQEFLAVIVKKPVRLLMLYMQANIFH